VRSISANSRAQSTPRPGASSAFLRPSSGPSRKMSPCTSSSSAAGRRTYLPGWLRRGTRPTDIDNSAEQLSTARSLQDEHDLHFPLTHGNVEASGVPDASFGLAVSEYGHRSGPIRTGGSPETARLLRNGGELVFLTNGTLWILTVPDTEQEGRRRSASCGPISAFIASSGRMIRGSSSTSASAIGSACSVLTDSR
jgi:hypothetical protein